MVDFNGIEIYYQFVITLSKVTLTGFSEMEIGGRYLYYDSRFRVFYVHDSHGSNVGVIIGFPYHQDIKSFLEMGGNGYVDLLRVENVDGLENILLPKLGGSFILLTWGCLSNRLYLDHAGSMPVVYDRRNNVVGSSAALILSDSDYEHRFNHCLYNALIKREGAGGWIPGTLTAHVDVERVLPNHYLDLNTGSVLRFWPKALTIDESMSTTCAAELIVESMSAFSQACFSSFPITQTLTAGYDSRLLLAVCRDFINEANFFTIDLGDNRLDVDISVDLSNKFGLKHKVIPVIYSNDYQKSIWDKCVGDSILEINRDIYPTLAQLDGDDFIITGMYGEIGRCRLYRQDYKDINNAAIDVDFILSRLTLPGIEEIKNNITQWFEEINDCPSSMILDLAFYELKFGSWAMGQNPIQNAMKYNIYPFALRPVMETFLRLTPLSKGTNLLFDQCIRLAWKDLTSIPVNKYGDYRDFVVPLKKIFAKNRLKRYLRDRFAKAWHMN